MNWFALLVDAATISPRWDVKFRPNVASDEAKYVNNFGDRVTLYKEVSIFLRFLQFSSITASGSLSVLLLNVWLADSDRR